MRRRLLFIVSLIVIILASWANVDYFGSVKTNTFSPIVNQVVHLVAFLLTAVIGYINWRGREKWVGNLWVALYVVALVVFLLSIVIFQFTGSNFVKVVGVGLRNRFTEPLPFLVFYLLIQLAGRLSKKATV